MAKTDSEKTPTMRLNAIRREWGLSSVDEATAQAQGKALEPLAKWLREGEDSPEVVVRAVQLLLADPELSGVDKHPAVETVIRQVSDLWANAGVEAQGMFGLQAMLLAAWPYDLNSGGFALAPLFDSAWDVMQGRTRQRAQLNAWRQLLLVQTDDGDSTDDVQLDVPDVAIGAPAIHWPENDPNLQHLAKYKEQNAFFSHVGAQIIDLFKINRQGFVAVVTWANSIRTEISKALANLTHQTETALNNASSRSPSTLDLMWWGQSRYSQAARRPYRRIENTTERLWWMAWEASEFALNLPSEPAASFLVETLYQLEGNVNEPKRPLKDWLGELILMLRGTAPTDALIMSETLKELATEDALGLPVTWARLEAMNPKGKDSDIGERAREALALDVDAPISRGDWAAWIFREALLDRHLHDHDEEQEED
ncbi:GTPase-associated system all-helical protein GASH [Archangium violaceum]|uniref:GTPase-associated system helical domain-containing protein n=1 Tax=Archangium violaceum Cb vi76 TaxID=1406225 RepID=A0A084SX22_9BACT|nr:GTPase-associated system all-helical protein GASH [Archangium violaceum]KFA93007.1 hypothetical protein Q664_12050 [Archangium violaceum Cb vi76]